MKKSLVFLILILVLPASFAIGISPPRLAADNLLRGSAYEGTVYLSGIQPGDSVSYEKSGLAKDWVSLDLPESSRFPESKSEPVKVTINVPDDAANGVYHCELTFKVASRSSGSGKTSLSFMSGVKLGITINVTGKEVKKYKVSSVSIPKSEVGFEFPVVIKIENSGNVMASPSLMELRVLDKYKTHQVLMKDVREIPGVKPHSTGETTVQIEHDLPQGDYWAQVKLYDSNGQVIYDEDIVFEIIDSSNLKKSGSLEKIDIPDVLNQDETLQVIGWFRNTGEAALNAKLISKIYLGNELVQVIESEIKSVSPGDVEPLRAYFSAERPGNYHIASYVTFSGKNTESIENSFVVEENSDEITGNFIGKRAINLGLLPIIAIAAIILLVYIYKRRE